MAKFLGSKIDPKSCLVLYKNQRSSNEGNRRQLFLRKGEVFSQLLFKPYNDKEEVTKSLLIAPTISSTDFLSPSEFWKIKFKKLASTARVKHSLNIW